MEIDNIVVRPLMVVSVDIRGQKAIAYVDYGQDFVYFPEDQTLNTDVMQRAVLAALDHSAVPEVKIPQTINTLLEKLDKIKSTSGVMPPNERFE